MGILANAKKVAIRQFIDTAAGPLDELAETLGVSVDDIAGAIAGVNKKSGMKTSAGENLEKAQKRLAKIAGPGIGERMATVAGEHVIPEASRAIGSVLENKYATLSRIMAAMQSGTSQRRRELYGPTTADLILSAKRAVAERKGANAKEVADRIANIVQGSSRYNRKENEKVRTIQAAIDPNLEGRTGMLREGRMLGKDAERVQKEE